MGRIFLLGVLIVLGQLAQTVTAKATVTGVPPCAEVEIRVLEPGGAPAPAG